VSPSEWWPRAWASARGVAGQLASPGVSIFWGYLLGAALIAAAVYVVRRRRVAGLLGYLAPREVWLRRSTFNDLALFVLNTLLYSFWLLAPLSWISQTLGAEVWQALHQRLGPMQAPVSGPLAMLGLSLVVFVVGDLAFFLAHLAMHRIPLLWEFHKVHHSAPVLQPVTVLRRHPVSIAVDGAITGALLGPVYGLAGWLGGGQLEPWTILGVNGLLFVALVLGFNLQHSHVWLSFGALDRLVISPATHQLHHSADPAHHDRNFGNFLAIWDRLAGSLLLPREVAERGEEPRLQFGLGAPGEAWEREYASVWRLVLWPVWRVLGRARGVLAIAALALGCSRGEPAATVPAGPSTVSPVEAELLEARLLNADGQPIAGIELEIVGGHTATTDAEGRATLELSSWRAAVPVVYLRATLPGGDTRRAVVPREARARELTLQLLPGARRDGPLGVVEANPQVQAWFEVLAWQAKHRERWQAASEPEAKRAVWAQVAEDIEAAEDPHTRALMLAAQFEIGRGDPEAGLTRQDAATRAIDELGLDDPRWAISPPALALAVFEAGRWESLDALDEQVSTHPQPEVAALVALERYAWANGEGDWDRASAIWARWKARPELHETNYGPLLEGLGPDRRLAPGKMLPELCVEALEPEGRLCTAEFEGLTVLELYAIWCEGCRKSFPEMATTLAALEGSEPAPHLVTIEVYNDVEEVRGFLAEAGVAGRHGWVREEEREAVRETLDLVSVPTMVLVGPDGRILDSNPQLRPENLEQRIRHWQAVLARERVD
jgi:sterol desaturase/sphingolipid hydroxylase (fatty acid hydroxylase superfamily)